jgi:hypothetical protein
MDNQTMTKVIHDWKYSANVDLSKQKMDLQIIPKDNIPVPDKLVKYYGLKTHNVDAMIKNYLYASHPFDLNDPFDCFSKLISFDNIPLDMCIRFMSLFGMPKDKTIELYNTKKADLFKTIESNFYDYSYSKIGIISMTKESLDMLMWTYYTEHRGFQVVFKTDNLKKILHGPFRINYIKTPTSVDFSDNVFIAALYQSNAKSDLWINENEWRFIGESFEPMRLPNRKELWDKQKERKFYYNKSDIDEIILGFSFFETDYCIDYSNNKFTFDFSKSDKLNEFVNLLDYLINNRDIKVSLFYIYNSLEYKITKRLIQIDKVKDNVYSYKQI